MTMSEIGYAMAVPLEDANRWFAASSLDHDQVWATIRVSFIFGGPYAGYGDWQDDPNVGHAGAQDDANKAGYHIWYVTEDEASKLVDWPKALAQYAEWLIARLIHDEKLTTPE